MVNAPLMPMTGMGMLVPARRRRFDAMADGLGIGAALPFALDLERRVLDREAAREERLGLPPERVLTTNVSPVDDQVGLERAPVLVHHPDMEVMDVADTCELSEFGNDLVGMDARRRPQHQHTDDAADLAADMPEDVAGDR